MTEEPTDAEKTAEALKRLDAVARRLRSDCPWDREQDERSIVPHTVEEAYELADAANHGDDAKLLDELGDVLYQVVFLALLMEERDAGSFREVAEHCRSKLIRRHPHVFGDAEAGSAAQVIERWEELKQSEPGRGSDLFADVPRNLPALLEARKVQRRVANVGFDWSKLEGVLAKLHEELEELERALAEDESGAENLELAAKASERLVHELGDLLFCGVNLARKLRIDPELALRQSTARFRGRVERAEVLSEAEGEDWRELSLAEQDRYFDRAKDADGLSGAEGGASEAEGGASEAEGGASEAEGQANDAQGRTQDVE